MILKQPELLAVGIKAERGLFYTPDAYALRPGLIEAVTGLFESTDLVAGQETEVVVSSDLPPNANVLAVTATLSVGPPRVTPDPPITSVSVVRGDEPAIGFDLSAAPPPGPSNVTLRVDGGEVFWTHSGSLADGSHNIPDFADQLNAYLDRLNSNGGVAVRFLVRSDTAGTASISLTNVDFTQLQTQAWQNPLDDTLRVDRNVDVDFGTEARFPLDPNHGDGRLGLSGVRLDIGGQLGSERLYGDVASTGGRELGTVSADYSLAQSLMFDTPITVVGLNGLFLAGEEPEVFVELQPDAGGTPASGRRPLAQGKLTFAPVEDQNSLVWRYFSFETPIDLEAETAYWVVLRAISGQALVALGGTHPNHALVNRGGQLWRPLGEGALAVAAVYQPGVDNQSAAVAIGLEGAAPLRVDPAGTEASLELAVAGAASPPVIVVRSYARGTLSIANVIQEFHR